MSAVKNTELCGYKIGSFEHLVNLIFKFNNSVVVTSEFQFLFLYLIGVLTNKIINIILE